MEFTLSWWPDGRPASGFRPDFYLPDYEVFVELTTLRQDLVTAKNNKVRRLNELYPGVSVKLLYRRDITSLIEKHRLGDATSTLAG